jgi:hypothetical protein
MAGIMFRALLAQTAAAGGGDVTTGMRWWYDAQALSGYVDMDPVPTWPDGSGNANTATAISGNSAWQPRYRTNALNGHPAVEFFASGGNSRGYTMPGGAPPGEEHLFIVSSVATASPPYHLGSQSFGPSFPATIDGTGTLQDHFGTTVARTCTPGVNTTTAGGGFIYHAHGATGQWDNDVNGVTKVNDPSNTVGYGSQLLGQWNFGGFSANIFQGRIGEFRVYDGALSSTDITNIENALATKWGITL